MKRKLVPPPTSVEDQITVTVRLPSSTLTIIDRIADTQIRSRSNVVRALCVEALQHKGLIERAGHLLDEVIA